MNFAYTFSQMRAADEAVKSGTPVSVLMERAGAALSLAVKGAAERLHLSDVLFVCGGGNNGGDGFVAAELLRKEGLEVQVLCLAEKFSLACLAAKEAFQGEVFCRMPRRRYPLLVDCVLGTGISRAAEGEALALIRFLNASGGYIVSCDVPSGLGFGGIAAGEAVRADETVCMGALKAELLLSDGADLAGNITVADIGIPVSGGAEVWEEADVKAFFPHRRSHSNKGDYGSVAILATCNILGAPLLSAGAALRSGAGYTEFYMASSSVPCEDGARLSAFQMSDELHRVLVAAKYPTCLFSFYDGEPIFTQAVAFGMGAGISSAVRDTLGELLGTYENGTLVLDADALNTISAYKMHDILKTKKCALVVTPHIKEFSRLTGKPIAEILADPISAAKAFAKEYGAVVVLKNNRTVITDGERVAINPTGSAALAKGGSGDALAGFLAGTCARGVPPFEAAVVSCYCLGKAGELASARYGEYASNAEDVIALLPEAIPR